MLWIKTFLSKTRSKCLVLLILVAAITWAEKVASNTRVVEGSSPFKIIIDGGSTGSRLHIFEFLENKNGVEEIERRGSTRVNMPLSGFGRLPSEKGMELNATEIAGHLLPLFEYAADIIPPEYHGSTPVKYAATAGMRLLDEDEQEAVYDALYEGLMESDSFVFKATKRQDIATLSGELEGFFGALAANYLKGLVNTKLHVQGVSEEAEHSGPIGALDMGGSSTQIVFLPGDDDVKTCPNSPTDDTEDDESFSQLNGDHFFKTSYLSYGVDQFRKRMWNTLVEERQSSCENNFSLDYFRERMWNTLVKERQEDGDDNPDSCVNKVIANPCANKGYTVEWEGFQLVGTGDTKECIRQTQRLIPHPELPHDNHAEIEQLVGGVEHPPVRGKFLAMSLYFFALDSLRVFSEPHDEAHKALNLSWPTPSIEELHNALDGLCSRNWEDDMALQTGTHSFTREEVLPHRCIETVYMVTLLKDGFGFHPSSRDITFTFLVDGSEVEWTLGMALSMHAENPPVDREAEILEPSINGTFAEEGDNNDVDDKRPVLMPQFSLFLRVLKYGFLS